MKYLSMDRLRRNHACKAGRNWFKENFGTGNVPVTREMLDKIDHAGYLGWLWNVIRHKNLLKQCDLVEVNKARDAWFATLNGSRAEAIADRKVRKARIDAILKLAESE